MGVVDMVFTTDGYYVSAVPEVNALSVSMLDGWEERAKGVNDFLDKMHKRRSAAPTSAGWATTSNLSILPHKPVKSAPISPG